MPKFKVGDEIEMKPNQSQLGYVRDVKRIVTAVGEHSYLYTANGEEYQESFTRLENNFQKKEPFWEVGKTYVYGRGSIYFEPQYLEQDSNGDPVAIGRERMGIGGAKTFWTVRRQFDPDTWTTE